MFAAPFAGKLPRLTFTLRDDLYNTVHCLPIFIRVGLVCFVYKRSQHALDLWAATPLSQPCPTKEEIGLLSQTAPATSTRLLVERPLVRQNPANVHPPSDRDHRTINRRPPDKQQKRLIYPNLTPIPIVTLDSIRLVLLQAPKPGCLIRDPGKKREYRLAPCPGPCPRSRS